MASIEKLPSGRWRVRWREGGRGSSVHKSPSVGTKAEAVGLKGRIEADLLARHAPHEGAVETLRTLTRAWAIARAGVRDPAYASDDLARLDAVLARYGWSDRVDLTPSDIATARSATKTLDGEPVRWSPRAGALLATVLRWAVDQRGARIDPRAIVGLRPGPVRRRAYPRDLVATADVDGWIARGDEIAPDCGALVHCLALYGWRPITAGRMRVGDVDLARSVIRARVKGGDVIEHPILAATADRLAPIMQGRKPTDPLFIDPRTGSPYADRGPYTVAAWWRWHIGQRSYDAKRFAISNLLRHGAPHEVARITGHRCPAVLFRYGTSTEDRSRELLAATVADQPSHGHTVGAPTTPGRSAPKTKKQKTPKKAS